jgi:hypothetical protein
MSAGPVVPQFSPRRLVDHVNMCAEDFGYDGIPLEPRVTIKRVEIETTGRKWKLLHFEEKWAKPLKLITTHVRALEIMFDPDDYRKWQGKRIDLYVMRGNFPNGKTTAVRIKGSPDIQRAYTFQMQKFGSREKDTYTLLPTGKNVVLGPGFVRFGQKAGHWGKPFSEFQPEQLAELVTYAEQQLANPEVIKKLVPRQKEDLEANVRELKEEIASRTAPPPDQLPPAEEEKSEELPV